MTDNERKEVELKPCPFCGNQPSISEAGHWAEVVISCNCHAVPQVVQRCVSVPNEDGKTFHYDNDRAKREAIDIWNSRPQDNNLVPLDIMAMRDCGQEAVRKELNQTHNWKLIRIVCEAIYAKFGKDNSGMIPNYESVCNIIRSHCHYDAAHEYILGRGIDSLANELCDNFSQQPPKERKVSLEEPNVKQ